LIGVLTIVQIKRTVYARGAEPAPIGVGAKALAVTSLLVWIAAIATGRWMAYV
jgi:hypothetical protein